MTVQFLVRDAASAGEDLTHLMRGSGVAPAGALEPALDAEPVASGSPAPAADATAGSSVGALVFSCNGRGTRMFAAPNHDIGCIQSAFETHVPAAGFLANGEIGPIGGRNFLHGFTASVAVFRPRVPAE